MLWSRGLPTFDDLIQFRVVNSFMQFSSFPVLRKNDSMGRQWLTLLLKLLFDQYE